MAKATSYAHIELRDDGVPIISGTRMKVEHLAVEATTWAMDADAIQRQHPHLSMGQVHSALAYYYDHKEEIDREIEEGDREAERLRADQADDSPARAKLKALGLIP